MRDGVRTRKEFHVEQSAPPRVGRIKPPFRCGRKSVAASPFRASYSRKPGLARKGSSTWNKAPRRVGRIEPRFGCGRKNVAPPALGWPSPTGVPAVLRQSRQTFIGGPIRSRRDVQLAAGAPPEPASRGRPPLRIRHPGTSALGPGTPPPPLATPSPRALPPHAASPLPPRPPQQATRSWPPARSAAIPPQATEQPRVCLRGRGVILRATPPRPPLQRSSPAPHQPCMPPEFS